MIRADPCLQTSLAQSRSLRPVSDDQERVWLASELDPGRGAGFNIGAVGRYAAQIEVGRFEEALRAVVVRHSSLRTSFVEVGGRLKRGVSDAPSIDLEFIDGSAEPTPDAELIRRVFHAAIRRPFDLESPPLWRAILLKLDHEQHAFIVVSSHAISDFRSIRMMCRELELELADNQAPILQPQEDVDEVAFERLLRSGDLPQVGAALERLCKTVHGTQPITSLGTKARPARPTLRMGSRFHETNGELLAALDRRARNMGGDLGSLLLASFQLLVHRQTGSRRFLVGVPIDGRVGKKSRSAFGFFAVPTIVRAEVDDPSSIERLVGPARLQLRNALRNRHVPFARVSDLIVHEHRRTEIPALQLLFSFLPLTEQPAKHPEFRREYVGPGQGHLDLWLTVQSTDERWCVQLDYNMDIFEDTDADALLEMYLEQLRSLVEPTAPETHGGIVVAATFVADPIVEVIKGWERVIGRSLTPIIAPYAQPLQQLLDPGSVLNRAKESRVVLMRLRDLFRNHDGAIAATTVRDVADEFLQALHVAASNSQTPLIVGLCPTEGDEGPALVGSRWRELEDELEQRMAGCDQFSLIGSNGWNQRYPVEEVFDFQANELAHVPYSPQFYTILGTVVLRRTTRIRRAPVKVVVVDCDNTLWSGVIGELGPSRIDLTSGHLALQHALVGLHNAGLLLCLCSKNDEEVIDEYFRVRDDSILQPEHITARAINWEPKSTNIAALAESLGLGLDSFVFLDDNPLEIEEVRSQLPEVLSVQVPAESERLGSFVPHLWALDVLGTTGEDARRPQMYREDRDRRRAMGTPEHYQTFLDNLNLVVETREIAERDLVRAAQLTRRTNQFNLTPRKHNEVELRALRGSGRRLRIVQARDRFGDYGIIGLVITFEEGTTLVLEGLMLSCRALGRGVEHRVMAELGREALDAGHQVLAVAYDSTARNVPARRFLERLAGHPLLSKGSVGLSPVDLVELEHRTHQAPPPQAHTRRLDIDRREEGKWMGEVAQRLTTADALVERLGVVAAGHHKDLRNAEPCQLIAAAWCEVLGVVDASLEDDFFLNAGGSSLEAVRLVARLRREFGSELGVDEFFADPTLGGVIRVVTTAHTKPVSTFPGSPMRCEMVLDAELPFSVVPASAPRPPQARVTHPEHLLLTGATGFLGGYVLDRLLRQTDATIHCLVRATDTCVGEERLRRLALERGFRWGALVGTRIVTVIGDLARSRFGLSDREYDGLADTLDGIVHCGAHVDFLRAYRSLRSANVLGTQHVLALACHGRPKAVHHVSTMGVLHGRRAQPSEGQSSEGGPGSGADLPTGYQQTKWTAERMIARARERGLAVSIYRPGTIAADSETGAANPNDLWFRLGVAGQRMGRLPSLRMDFLPVDWVADAIVALASRPDSLGETHHLVHPAPPSPRKVARWYALAGLGVQFEPVERWLQSLNSELGRDPDNLLAVLAPVLVDGTKGQSLLEIIENAPPPPTQDTSRRLAAAGYEFPPIGRRLLSTYYDWMRAHGHLPTDEGAPRGDRYLLWFPERMEGWGCRAVNAAGASDPWSRAAEIGEATETPIRIELTSAVDNLHVLTKTRRLQVIDGRIDCPALYHRPLEIKAGYWQLSPPRADTHYLHYHLELEAAEGRRYVMRGHKNARPAVDVFRQTTTLRCEFAEQSEPNRILAYGIVTISPQHYIEDQLRDLRVSDRLNERQKAQAKAAWLAVLGLQLGQVYATTMARRGYELARGLFVNGRNSR